MKETISSNFLINITEVRDGCKPYLSHVIVETISSQTPQPIQKYSTRKMKIASV